MDYNFLKVENHDNGITVVAISVPQSLNALNSKVLSELERFIDNLDISVRVLVITGDGPKSFVAGADISEMKDLNEKGGLSFGQLGARVFRKIEVLDIPVIAAVNGYALGGGCELAMACDIRIASENARFGQPETGLGIIPGFSGTYRLSKLVGQAFAKEIIYTGRTVKSDEALKIGLVNAVVPQEELLNTVMAMAVKITANAPISVKYAKKSINEGYDLSTAGAIALENEYFAKCFNTKDQKEGMDAFLSKRKASFTNE